MASCWCDRCDRLAVLLTLLPAAALLAAPWPLLAVAIWWLGNTVAHHAVHRRTFRPAWLQAAFALWLSLLLGVPQQLWRERHLAHHAGRPHRWCGSRGLLVQSAALLVAHALALWLGPAWWVTVWLPGFVAGMTLAALHGHFEHRGGVTDLPARWWNTLLLNDGWHAEHHAFPARHWRELGREPMPHARHSGWPPPLRWLTMLRPAALLDAAERLVLRSAWLRARVLAVHRRALAGLLANEPPPRHVVVVGGGLFPRSALLLRERFPTARITVLDANAAHLGLARVWLPADVDVVCRTFTPGERLAADLVVLPLALRGARSVCCAMPPAPRVLVHDWLWCARGRGVVVAWWLGKRLHLLRAAAIGAPSTMAPAQSVAPGGPAASVRSA